MQSVLVTVDRQEWYAQPLIYTRNDSTGLWTARPAILPDSLLLTSSIRRTPFETEFTTTTLADVSSHLEDKHQYGNIGCADGYARIQADEEIAVEQSHLCEDANTNKKRRREEEDSNIEGSSASNGTMPELKERRFECPSNLENADLSDSRVATATNASLTATNSSPAEHVIEPALVMFEVGPIYLITPIRSLSFSQIIFSFCCLLLLFYFFFYLFPFFFLYLLC